MPRNSQGLYTLPPGNPVVPNTLIESAWANTTMDDIGAALTASLPRDGSAPMTGPLTLSADPITGTRQATTKAYVDSFLAYATGMPIGSVVAYAGTNIPAGFFECNGQAVSRTTYADLFTAIGTTYGSGDNVNTFNVPDMRGEFIRGKSDTRPLGSKQAGSFASHTHTSSDPGHGHTLSDPGHAHGASQPAHAHGVNDPGHYHAGGSQVSGVGASGSTAGAPWLANTDPSQTYISIQSAQPGVTVNAAVTGASAASNTTGIVIGGTGGTETVPQNIAQIYIIKAVNDYAGGGGGGTGTLTGITSSDPNMIAIDNTNPAVPLLDIQTNVAFGISNHGSDGHPCRVGKERVDVGFGGRLARAGDRISRERQRAGHRCTAVAGERSSQRRTNVVHRGVRPCRLDECVGDDRVARGQRVESLTIAGHRYSFAFLSALIVPSALRNAMRSCGVKSGGMFGLRSYSRGFFGARGPSGSTSLKSHIERGTGLTALA